MREIVHGMAIATIALIAGFIAGVLTQADVVDNKIALGWIDSKGTLYLVTPAKPEAP